MRDIQATARPGTGARRRPCRPDHADQRGRRPGAIRSRTRTCPQSRLGASTATATPTRFSHTGCGPGATRDAVVIGLDTNQAGALVGTWDALTAHSPGSQGHVRLEQLLTIEGWVTEAIRDSDIVVLAGHDNWRSLGLPTRTLLRGQMDRLDHPLVYLSVHTQSGFWAVHREVSRRPLLELNVSSLWDWPIAYRRISFACHEAARRLRVRGELMPRGDAPHASYADLLAAWERKACTGSGVPAAMLRDVDVANVRRQRESRGTLVEWLLVAAGPACESGEPPLYAHAYLDARLEVLLRGDAILKSVGRRNSSHRRERRYGLAPGHPRPGRRR